MLHAAARSSFVGVELPLPPPSRQWSPTRLCLPRPGPLPLSLPGADRSQYTCHTSLNAPSCIQRAYVEWLFERVLSQRTRRGASFLIAHPETWRRLQVG